MDFCCFDEDKVRNSRKGKSRAFFKSLAFLMHMVLLLPSWKEAGLCLYQSKKNLSIRFFAELS
ncbi:hypothetical protein H839_10954 [Parageobacillus genomosp. 1]|uniref:Transposase n=1 Tax=Parageobacillus genomosp. 1 TaxID=1295642 RepID=A0ABC9VBN9_9BACL|nr:hypothetical protein H839_10954 [Parageobacillus genomosp. 1]